MQCEDDPNVIYGGDVDDSIDEFRRDYASLGDLILSDLLLGDDHTAFVNGVTDDKLTFSELRRETLKIARSLHGAGIVQNDFVAIISENRFEFPAISFAATCINSVVAPINPAYTEYELKHAIDLSKPRIVFVSSIGAEKVIKICSKLNYVQLIILIDGKSLSGKILSLSDFIQKYEDKNFDVENHVKQKIRMEEQSTLILLSSGTTGLPKGVEITQANILSVIKGSRESLVMMNAMLDGNIMYFNVAPWFHVLGYVAMTVLSCSRGGTFVFLTKFEPRSFLRAIEKNKVNLLVIVPPIMVFLSKSPLFDEFDLSSVKEIACGAAHLSAEVEEQVRKRFKDNVQIRQGYGMSELTFATLAASIIAKPGSVGQPVKGIYAKIVDEQGKSLGANKVGELCFKGNRIMKGYKNNPKATAEMIDKDGWLHSGDLAYYDEDFQFYIVDRLKELIKYKAFQVAPAELEGLLLSNPKIKDCGVIGIPDENAGELPLAFVVKQSEISEEDVKSFVKENASNAKWLRGGVKFINEIPKNPSGKILRRQLRDLYKSLKAKL